MYNILSGFYDIVFWIMILNIFKFGHYFKWFIYFLDYEEPNSSKTTAIYSSESKHLNMNVTTAETNPESNVDSENCIFNGSVIKLKL